MSLTNTANSSGFTTALVFAPALRSETCVQDFQSTQYVTKETQYTPSRNAHNLKLPSWNKQKTNIYERQITNKKNYPRNNQAANVVKNYMQSRFQECDNQMQKLPFLLHYLHLKLTQNISNLLWYQRDSKRKKEEPTPCVCVHTHTKRDADLILFLMNCLAYKFSKVVLYECHTDQVKLNSLTW